MVPGELPEEFEKVNPTPEEVKKAGESPAEPSSSKSSSDSNALTMIRSHVAVPNFKVNDDSKIEVTACEHEFEVSMAKNDFSSTSVEASL